jgi:DNA-binding transcriptional regulator LsrR (DeoR family)
VADGDRLAGRDGAIWQSYIRGATQESIARKFGISQQRVSAVIKEVRDNMPEETKQEIVQREIEMLYTAREHVIELMEQAVATGEAKLALDAVDRLVRVGERQARLLGLDAATKVEANVTADESTATIALAADAARRVAGDGK